MNLKTKLEELIFPFGSDQRILKGPLKNFKYRISSNSGWAPILGRWEPQLQELFSKIIQKDDIVYDLGANVGIHSLLASKLVGEKGKVVAFEPFKDNIQELNANISINHIKNITIAPFAVSENCGKALFNIGIHNKQGSLFNIGNNSGTGIEIETTTLDDYTSKTSWYPDFLKIDIEGAESTALKGYEQTISKSWPTMVIELHTPEQDKNVGEFMTKMGYTALRVNVHKKLRLEKIKDYTLPYPEPDGFWGHVLVYHESRRNQIEGLINIDDF